MYTQLGQQFDHLPLSLPPAEIVAGPKAPAVHLNFLHSFFVVLAADQRSAVHEHGPLLESKSVDAAQGVGRNLCLRQPQLFFHGIGELFKLPAVSIPEMIQHRPAEITLLL